MWFKCIYEHSKVFHVFSALIVGLLIFCSQNEVGVSGHSAPVQEALIYLFVCVCVCMWVEDMRHNWREVGVDEQDQCRFST